MSIGQIRPLGDWAMAIQLVDRRRQRELEYYDG